MACFMAALKIDRGFVSKHTDHSNQYGLKLRGYGKGHLNL